MASSHIDYNHRLIIPEPNGQALADGLAGGQITVAVALSQLNNFVRVTLRTIEEFSEAQAKLHLDRKCKGEKMDKIIQELSEKCQAMQQALLFKEEKYDEKCREVERYKVICEWSAKAAVSDNIDLASYDENGNITMKNNQLVERGGADTKIESQQSDVPRSVKRHMVKHAKFSDSQAYLSQYVEPLQSRSPPPIRDDYNSSYLDNERRMMAHCYAGGPSTRKTLSTHDYRFGSDARVRERMEIIGGINVRGPHMNPGPIPLSRLVDQPTLNSYTGELDKDVKVEMTSQRNELTSSSGNNALKMKRKIVEKDLNKQVVGGSWTRLASRRKKDWPF